MRIIKPKKLVKGALIGIISPSSPIDDISKIEKGVSYLEKQGFNVIVGKNVGVEKGYLAGEDSDRLDDLHAMFKNKEVKAIFSLRGGYGSGRLLNKLDYNLIKNNPKIFVGYSDITALQMAIYAKTGLVSFAGLMVGVDFYDEVSEFAEEIFWRTITSNKKIGRIENPNGEKIYVMNKGRAQGRLLGGNLTVLTSLLGTPYLPSFKDAILFLEDINEQPYRIDRMLNQLKLSKMLSQIRGVVLGRFVNCYESDMTKKTLSLNEVILEYFSNIKIPVVYNVKHGHTHENITLPVGLKCNLNASRSFIEILENAVS